MVNKLSELRDLKEMYENRLKSDNLEKIVTWLHFLRSIGFP